MATGNSRTDIVCKYPNLADPKNKKWLALQFLW